MKKLILFLFVLLLMVGLSATEVYSQSTPVKPRKKPPTTTTTTQTKPTKPTPPKTPRLSQAVRELEANMVRVESGTFMMGATSEQGSDAANWEKPAHHVTLSSFSICKYEVTQELWESVMGSNPSEFNGAKRPVENVSWEDCQIFIKKLNQLTGKKYRLPTEAEWEYAARGGNRSNGYKYAGGNNVSDVAWYKENSENKTHDVGTKRANELGLYDMAGNVWEWCSDWYGDYSSSSQKNPKGPSSGDERVFRGGGWVSLAKGSRVSYRGNFAPWDRDNSLGLRLAQ